MSSGSASLFDMVAVTAVVVVVAVVLLVVLMRRAAAYPYRGVGVLLSTAEGELLAALRQALGSDYEVYPKVRLADVIDVRKGLTRKQRTEALEHIAGRHVGFVVCDRETQAIRGVIELDAGGGRRAGRHAPLPFLDAALAAAHVPLLRVPVQATYATAELRDRVLATLQPAEGQTSLPPGSLKSYFGPAAAAEPAGRWRGGVVGRTRVGRDRRGADEGPGSAAAWLPTRGVLAIAAVLLIVGAVLSWFVEPNGAPPKVGATATPAAAAPAAEGPAAEPAAPTVEPPKAPEKPPEIIGYRDVRVPGKPLAECMGPDREIGPEVLRCRDGYTRREPIYR
jgi:hypothetical protein